MPARTARRRSCACPRALRTGTPGSGLRGRTSAAHHVQHQAGAQIEPDLQPAGWSARRGHRAHLDEACCRRLPRCSASFLCCARLPSASPSAAAICGSCSCSALHACRTPPPNRRCRRTDETPRARPAHSNAAPRVRLRSHRLCLHRVADVALSKAIVSAGRTPSAYRLRRWVLDAERRGGGALARTSSGVVATAFVPVQLPLAEDERRTSASNCAAARRRSTSTWPGRGRRVRAWMRELLR